MPPSFLSRTRSAFHIKNAVYAKSNATMTAPSIRPISLSSAPKSTISADEPISTGKSIIKESFCTGETENIAESPKMSKILVILLPRTFPIAIPTSSCNAEITEVASSGAEVPNATTVSPITS